MIGKKLKNKKNNSIIMIGSVLLILIIAILIYILLIKPKNNNVEISGSDLLSEEKAITIAKEKLDLAVNFFGDFRSSAGCSDNIGNEYCYYDLEENFRSKFYSVYSKELKYNDVFNITADAAGLKISNGKAYVHNNCSRDVGARVFKGKDELMSISNNSFTVKYANYISDSSAGDDIKSATIKLVKENNDWKVMNVSMLGNCNSIYEAGKKIES